MAQQMHVAGFPLFLDPVDDRQRKSYIRSLQASVNVLLTAAAVGIVYLLATTA